MHGAGVKSLALYSQINPLAFGSTDLAPDTVQHNAALAVVSALYYAAGEAAAYETPENAPPPVSPLGSDMADVGYEDMVECLERAASSAADTEAETRWQQELIERLWQRRVRDTDCVPNSLGEKLELAKECE